jgi:erythronate-4-phosphate dehydrogenase
VSPALHGAILQFKYNQAAALREGTVELMKIIVDNKIPYIKGALEPFAEVIYLAGNQTTRKVIRDADALITRTRTICNKDVLEGSAVKFIATATIGFDHIDTDYCKLAGIEWAPGKLKSMVSKH